MYETHTSNQGEGRDEATNHIYNHHTSYTLATWSINLERSLVTQQPLLPPAPSFLPPSFSFFLSSLLGPAGQALGDGEL